MAQIFPKWTNKIPLFVGLGGPVFGALTVAGVWYFLSPEYTDVGYRPRQPVPYSHKLHVGELGLDCRYCHASVEQSSVSNIPPTTVCMNCHSLIKKDSELLEPIRASEQDGISMRWVRVHNLPDYAYFHHAAHVRAGVGCVSCHGQINEMEVVMQAEPLSMSWCLDCHRDPAPYLRPTEEVTNMEWFPPRDHAAWALAAIAEEGLDPPQDCSGCHR